MTGFFCRSVVKNGFRRKNGLSYLISFSLIAVQLLVVWSCCSCSFVSASTSGPENLPTYDVPTFRMSDFRRWRKWFQSPLESYDSESIRHSLLLFRRALSRGGLIAIEIDESYDEEDDSTFKAGQDTERSGCTSFRETRQVGLSGLCSCTAVSSGGQESSLFRSVRGTDSKTSFSSTLSSSSPLSSSSSLLSSRRTTLATATVGETPLALPVAELAAACGTEVVDALETIRDVVADASKAFVRTLDDIIASANRHSKSSPNVLESSTGHIYSTVQSVLRAATHLEHYHVYDLYDTNPTNHNTFPTQRDATATKRRRKLSSSSSTSQAQLLLDLHTDAGLFLSFVPGLRCNNDNLDKNYPLRESSSSSSQHSFLDNQHHSNSHRQQNDESNINSDLYVQLDNGVLAQAVFPPNTVGIMLGIGAQNWLLQQQQQPPYTQTNKVQDSLVESDDDWICSGDDRTHSNVNRITFRATKHAVRMPVGTTRAWYGKMHLVPPQAIIQRNPTPRTFADMRRAMVLTAKQANNRRTYRDSLPKRKNLTNATDIPSKELSHGEGHDENNNDNEDYNDNESDNYDEEFISIGCGTDESFRDTLNSKDTPDSNDMMIKHRTRHKKHRRRLQMVDDASVCNNQTNFYCWMSCLSIPDATNAASRLQAGESLYCADATILARQQQESLLPNATSACNTNNGRSSDPIIGGAMNVACSGVWEPTYPGLPVTPIVVPNRTDPKDNHSSNTNYDNSNEHWCLGGTSMYMDGFHWLHPVCVIYLFPKWTLTTPSKMIAASFGTILFGIAIEGTIRQRRVLVSSMPIGWNRLFTSAFFYGLQLSMGYLIMLVVMTYSGPLFVSVIIGFMIGHVICNAPEIIQAKKDEKNKTIITEAGDWGTNNNHSATNNNSIDPIVISHHDFNNADNCSSSTTNENKNDEFINIHISTTVTNDISSNKSNHRNLSPNSKCCNKSQGNGIELSNIVPEGVTPCCQNTL